MAKTAKLFMTGRSQAVRLPKEFRFEGKEVEVRRDPATGGVLLMPADEVIRDWNEFFAEIDQVNKEIGIPDDFLRREPQPPIEDRDIFKDWEE